VSDWLWQYSDIIRITLAVALAWIGMDAAERVLFEEEDTDDGTE